MRMGSRIILLSVMGWTLDGQAFAQNISSTPPADCPFQKSDSIAVKFTGRHAEYTGADTWYPSWASDGNLYSPWTDGNVNGLEFRLRRQGRHHRHTPRSSATIR